MKTALIGGGTMGEAIIKSLIRKKLADKSEITVSEVVAARREQLKKRELLEKTLAEYNSGQSKSVICLSFLLLDIDTINDLLETAKREIRGSDIRTKAKEFRALLETFVEKAKSST